MSKQADNFDEYELFVCDCSDASHNIIFQLWDWNKDGKCEPDWGDFCELNVWVNLGDYPSFWKRFWLGIRYIFGYKSRFGKYDVFSIRYKDVPRMKALLDRFAKKVEEYAGDKGTS